MIAISILLPIFLFVVWLAWVMAGLLDKAAKGDTSGTSILPAIPLFPLVAWGIAAALDWLHNGLGLAIVGGFHLLLLVSFLFSALKSLCTLRKNRKIKGTK